MEVENVMKKLFSGSKGARKSLLEFLDKKGFYIVLMLCIVVVGATVVLVTTHNITSTNEGYEGEDIIPDGSEEDYFSDLGSDLEGYSSDEEPIGTEKVTPGENGDETKVADSSTSTDTNANTGTKTASDDKANETGVKSSTNVAENTNKSSSKDTQKDSGSKAQDNKNDSSKTDKNSSKNESTNKDSGSKTSIAAEEKFIMPVLGEITFDYSMDKLVYSKTLEDWRTHSGVDIAADRGTPVKAVAKGVVSSIKNDPRFGITVIIEHSNGIKTVYSNLASAEMVHPNQKIEQGEIIGSVGDTAIFESAERSHLHFEVLKNDEPVDPKDYLPYS